MAIKHYRGYKKVITALKFIPLVLIIYTCEDRTFNNPFDTDAELNPDDWAPTNLTIEILSDSDAKLTWQNSKTNITLYKIEKKISTGSSFVEVGSSDTTNYTDTGLLTGNEYIYQVCAYAGDQKSSYISSDTIKTVFSAPYNFSAESLSSGIVLTWEDSTAFEESFQVERKAISSSAYTILDSTQANTYLDSVITLGNQYIYRVSAFSSYNSTSYTETVVVKYWQDCLDVWEGDAEEDNCGTCDNDASNDCNMDCAGVENGTAVEDCSGECGGTAVEDECGVCNGSGSPENYDCSGNCTANVDCNGDCGGSAIEDACGVCGGSGPDEGYNCSGDCVAGVDCAGECGGSAIEDECGVCSGDGTTCSTTVTDIDGNVYETVQIGDQLWMAENLKVTKYKDGTAIPTGHSDSDWSNLSTDAYALYAPAPTCGDCYGKYYNWYAVDYGQGLCMEGWHVPSDDEWTVLTNYLGGLSVAGGKMKEEGLDHWDSPNTGATNESGFTALPAGIHSGSEPFQMLGKHGYFWSSSESNSNIAWYRNLGYGYSGMLRFTNHKDFGFSLRCLKD